MNEVVSSYIKYSKRQHEHTKIISVVGCTFNLIIYLFDKENI